MQKRNILNSPRLLELKKHRRKVFRNKILIYLFIFIIIFVGLSFLSRLKQLNIGTIEIVGNKVLDTETLRTVVEGQINGRYLGLFSKTNILFYPKNNIKNELRNKFKRIKDLNISVTNNKIIEISLTERTALYTWCGTVPELVVKMPSSLGILTTNNQCYFLDENGYIIDEAPYFSGEVYFKFYGSSEGLGSYFSKENFKKLILFKDILISFGLKPVAFYLTNNGDAEVFLSKETSHALTTGPKIIFKQNADFQNIAENLEAALNTEPLKSKFKNKYSSLLYIDLRFGNKVYDKFLE